MSNLEFNGKRVAPELSKKLFEHYPKLEMQLDVLVQVTHEMERLVEKTNAILGDAVPNIAGAIERAREAAVNTSIPISVQPKLETLPVSEVPLPENVIAANGPDKNVEDEVSNDQSVITTSITEQGRAVSTATGQLLHKIWRRM